MLSSSSYLLDGLDFSDAVVMDAGTGAGTTTLLLARKVAKAGGSGSIVSIDSNPAAFARARERLGDLAHLVQFVQANLTGMPQIGSAAFDIVVCTGTLCATNDRPLGAMRALAEFHRVLRDGGWLVIGEEYPLPRATRPEEELQALRWNIYKAVAELTGKGHYTEIYPEELEFAASLVGFRDIQWQRFGGGPIRRATMDEWREVMNSLAKRIENGRAREAFLDLVASTFARYLNSGGRCPPTYIMKMRKHA